MILDFCCALLCLKQYISDFSLWFLYMNYFDSYYEHDHSYDYQLDFFILVLIWSMRNLFLFVGIVSEG